jgi:hypothetical protein
MSDFDWPEAPPLDVEIFSRFLMKLFDEEFRKQADYVGLREVRYSPYSYSDLRSGIDQLVQQFDGMRTELIKELKRRVTDLVRVTPGPPMLMKLEDAAKPFVMAERERCARLVDDYYAYTGWATARELAAKIREGK